MHFHRRDVLKAIPALLVGCGGKSDGPVQTGTFYPQSPKGKIFCYYGSKSGEAEDQFKNTQDHVSHHWIMPWSGVSRPPLAGFQAANSPIVFLDDIKIIYGPTAVDYGGLVSEFENIKQAKWLNRIDIIYPQDEPNIAASVVDFAAVRRAMANFTELKSARLATIYAGSNRNRPMFEHCDLVGVDNYGKGVAVLDDEVNELRNQLRPAQQILLVVGGADPWKSDPEPFYRRLVDDDRIAGIVAFTYFDNTDPAQGYGLGINHNGMLPAYRSVGLRMR